MKTVINIASIVGLLAVSPLVMADQCPDSLNAEQMYDCIVVEGAGGTYKPEDKTTDESAKTSLPAEKHPDQQARAENKRSVN